MFEFFKKKTKSNPDENTIVSFSRTDPFLEAYKKKAQDELDYLIDFMAKNGNGTERFSDEVFKYGIKVKFTEGKQSEYMWVKVNEFKNGRFIGTLNNKPNTMKLVNFGDEVTVLPKDVEDWILQDLLTHTKVGHFLNNYVKGNANRESQ